MKPEFISTGSHNWSIDHPVYRAIMDAIDWDWDIAIVPTRPLYDGPKPWLVFIEDWVTLYNPEIINGNTAGVDVLAHPKTAELRKKFDDPRFRGIVCHHRGTFQDLVYLGLTDKLFYMPYGVPTQSVNRIGLEEKLAFTFINSWRAGNGNFVPRGGELVCRAFKHLWDAGERGMFLNIVAEIPASIGLREFLLSCPNVHVVQHHVSHETMDFLMSQTDCLLLPSHRVHCNSLLMPMSYGIPVISSDGWGNEEYVLDGITGYRVRGVSGRVTWHNQVMREDYSRWRETLPAVDGVAQCMMKVMHDRDRLRTMGVNAAYYVRSIHTIERMKHALLTILGTP